MSNYRVEKKEGFRIVGYKTVLTGSEHIHSSLFSSQKTEFFKGIIQEGKLASLRPWSESPYGYGAVVKEGETVLYYAGVKTSRPLADQAGEVLFPEGDYLVLTGSGGLSRLAFDKLEDQAFNEILNGEGQWEYAGAPLAEILLNGNPADAEVEVWIPVTGK
ncbi:MAG: hypothetical protein K0R57_5041 [Paenibacillaceae bacterium]|jgi:predicted transcriptional regulator YdeE|nr:hypothetical protein [Paenibacillaceae bacterium]